MGDMGIRGGIGDTSVGQDIGWVFAHALARGFRATLRLLPRSWVDALAVALGILWFDVLRVRRKTILSNIAIAFPDWDRRRRISVGRASVISFCRTTFEFLDADRVFSRAHIAAENESILDEALTRGKGVYILCCHLGNWELMCQYGGHRFRPVHVVVKPVGKGPLLRWVEELREKNLMHVIRRTGPSGELTATREIFRALKTGDMVGFMADQRRAKGTVAPFFGRNCATNDSLVQLNLRREAPVIPVSLVRTGLDAFKFVVWPEVHFEKVTEDEAKVRNVVRMNEVIEAMVRECPEQYFWLHKRWKL